MTCRRGLAATSGATRDGTSRWTPPARASATAAHSDGKRSTDLSWHGRTAASSNRVAAGLLELWAETDSPDAADSEAASGLSFRIDSVRATRHIKRSWSFPTRDVLEYDLRLLAPGPHLLVLPFPRRFTTLLVVSTERAAGNPKPQLVAVAGENETLAAVVFGSQQQPGERIHIQVEHRPRRIKRTGNPVWSRYLVDRPVEELVLAVDLNEGIDVYKWQVTSWGPITSNAKIIDAPRHRTWRCEKPDVGSMYQLYGTKLHRAQRERVIAERRQTRRARLGISPPDSTLDKTG
jgi:hypothetical protein